MASHGHRSSAACADLVALLSMIIYSAPWVIFSCVLFSAGFIFRGSPCPMKIKVLFCIFGCHVA